MINLLVVTSDPAFGDLLRQNLEGTGRFRVCVAGDSRTAVSWVKGEDSPLAFLDSSVEEQDLLEVGKLVRHANPEIRFIAISEAGWHPALEELAPEDYLSKPIDLRKLVNMMDNLFPSTEQPAAAPGSSESDNNLPWLSNVTRAAQHLTRLTLESSAQAALITCDDQMWAYAGQLPQSSTQELTETVLRYWDRQKENDLVRFVHLASTGAEHMLYATRLTGNMVLALIFDAETPFSTIHTQANQLVHSLSTGPSENLNDNEPAEADSPSMDTSARRSDAHSPNPGADAKEASLKYIKNSNLIFHFDPSSSSRDAEPSIDLEKVVEAPPVFRKNKFKRNIFEREDLRETRPSPLGESARKIVLEPISASVYNLDYFCLLVPRFPQHHLIGDLSECLADWLNETCIAYAWRLESISVRPDYLQWIVNVPPPTAPSNLMRLIRQRTSEKIFDEFPRYKKENPSGDFWAPGYLILGGSQPPPVQLIKEFIAQTRQRQGIPLQQR